MAALDQTSCSSTRAPPPCAAGGRRLLLRQRRPLREPGPAVPRAEGVAGAQQRRARRRPGRPPPRRAVGRPVLGLVHPPVRVRPRRLGRALFLLAVAVWGAAAAPTWSILAVALLVRRRPRRHRRCGAERPRAAGAAALRPLDPQRLPRPLEHRRRHRRPPRVRRGRPRAIAAHRCTSAVVALVFGVPALLRSPVAAARARRRRTGGRRRGRRTALGRGEPRCRRQGTPCSAMAALRRARRGRRLRRGRRRRRGARSTSAASCAAGPAAAGLGFVALSSRDDDWSAHRRPGRRPVRTRRVARAGGR